MANHYNLEAAQRAHRLGKAFLETPLPMNAANLHAILNSGHSAADVIESLNHVFDAHTRKAGADSDTGLPLATVYLDERYDLIGSLVVTLNENDPEDYTIHRIVEQGFDDPYIVQLCAPEADPYDMDTATVSAHVTCVTIMPELDITP